MTIDEKPRRVTTPTVIEFLLHCHYSPNPYPKMSPAIRFIIKDLMTTEIIEETAHKDVYQLTERGQAWVDKILSVPMPVKVWV